MVKDNGHFVYWSCLFLGVLCLLPWDICVTVTSYWQEKFAQNQTFLTPLQKEFETYINIAAGCGR